MRISSTRAAKRFGEIVRKVNDGREPAIIERYGKAVAGIISPRDLEWLGTSGRRGRGSGSRSRGSEETLEAGRDEGLGETGTRPGPRALGADANRETVAWPGEAATDGN